MLEYREYAPARALAPYLRCYWSMRADASDGESVHHRVLPDGCLDIVFAVRPGSGESWLTAVGAMTTFLPVDALPLTLGARFRPGRGHAFLAPCANAMTDLQVDLRDLWGNEGRRLHENLRHAESVSAGVGAIEEALLRRLGCLARLDPAVTATVDHIVAADGALPLRGLATDISWRSAHR